jgi:hypothetical protein
LIAVQKPAKKGGQSKIKPEREPSQVLQRSQAHNATRNGASQSILVQIQNDKRRRFADFDRNRACDVVRLQTPANLMKMV